MSTPSLLGVRRGLRSLNVFTLISAALFFTVLPPTSALAKKIYFGPEVYEQRLLEFKADPRSFDRALVRTLRMHYASTPEYKQHLSDPAMAVSSDPSEAELKEFKNFVDTNYMILSSHAIYLNIANLKTGSREEKTHRDALIALLDAIMELPDGKSAKTAYTILVPSEEYIIIGALGSKVISQALVVEDGLRYDLLTVVRRKDGVKSEVWFNVELLFRSQ